MSKKILVVDDNLDAQRLLHLHLEAHGYEVVSALDGIEAASKARSEKPDLVLLDLGLPAGDGFTVLQRFASIPQLARIPVVVISARDADPAEQEVRAAGALDFFSKPLSLGDLLEYLEEAVERRPPPLDDVLVG